jgi:hypothetical protein
MAIVGSCSLSPSPFNPGNHPCNSKDSVSVCSDLQKEQGKQFCFDSKKISLEQSLIGFYIYLAASEWENPKKLT